MSEFCTVEALVSDRYRAGRCKGDRSRRAVQALSIAIWSYDSCKAHCGYN